MRRLRSVRLENFRSIYSAKVDFGEFNVLIGANGSGKSNLVKAIEMIADVQKSGLVAAVANQGWGNSIVPKRFDNAQVFDVPVKVEYEVDLGNPEGKQSKVFKNIDNPISLHSLLVTFPESDQVFLEKEVIKFTQVAQLGCVFGKASDEIKANESEIPAKSHVRFYKNNKGDVSATFKPKLNGDNYFRFVHGLGLDFVSNEDVSSVDLKHILQNAFKEEGEFGKDRVKRISQKSMFEMKGYASIFPPYSRHKDIVGKFSRFDILLSNIRFEQKANFSSSLLGDGRNLPSVIKEIKDNSQDEVWDEISSTLEEIAPHVFDVGASNLATGKQYLEFSEYESKRKVESWDTSDGTLRAVSIIAAVEGAPKGSVLIIEEPEQNLHPWAVRSLIEHIRGAIKRKGLQVLVTTHSQQVLEVVDPEEVILTKRSVSKGTQFYRLKDVMAKSKKIEMGEVGRLWVKGLLGGVPGDGE